MHLADRFDLPEPYRARPYLGPTDLPAMAEILGGYRVHHGVPEMPTVEDMNVTYSNLDDGDPDLDIAIIEVSDEPVGYVRTSWEDLDSGSRDCVVFAPTTPSHLSEPLFTPLVLGQETHMRRWADDVDIARFRAYAAHPGPGREPEGEAAWIEALGYAPAEWGASLVRPHLDDIPERSLPDVVELRPVTEEQVRPIVEAHLEAFRGEWDFREPTAADYAWMIDHPHRDESLWKVAWAGDDVVGQVKSFINHEENERRNYKRGYTEFIATHHDWRNQGIAGALLAMSLTELKERGMTEAALGVDTNNPGGAFELYTGLGFELQQYEAVYAKPVK